MRKISMKDIANVAKLSKTTVSWILNDKGEEKNISPETIERVLAIAEELNYRPNHLAKSLSLGKSNTIGLIVPRITDTFFAEIAQVLETEAAKKGYTVFYGSTDEREDKERNLINTFLGKQVDGLIIASSLLNRADIDHLIRTSFPFVLIDRFYTNLNANYVVVEDQLATHKLILQLAGRGKKNIAMVTVSSYLSAIQEREFGYKRALAELNITFNPSMLKEVDIYDMNVSVRKAIDTLLKEFKEVDSIFFVTHYLAALGFKYLRELNITIPKEIAICCFGDSPYLQLINPSITAIPMPTLKIGEESLRILLNQIENKTTKTEQIELPVEIVERESW